jgi:uncharacterized membrane protein
MEKNVALKITLGISVVGMLFSGYLSYGELFQRVCPVGGGCSFVLGAPSCVYGFVMYAVVFVVSLLGLQAKRAKTL